MDNGAGWLLLHFGREVQCAHGMILVPARIASHVLDRALDDGVPIIGAEGFELVDGGQILARLDRIADFSGGEPRPFVLDQWSFDEDLLVEFVFGDSPVTVFVIDGEKFDDLAGFFHIASRTLMATDWETSNLDGFNDILRGGFGRTPDGGYTLVWRNAARSARVLGHEATATWLHERLETVHSSNRANFQERLALAKRGEGETLFDILLSIIFSHCRGGVEEEDGVRFVLEA